MSENKDSNPRHIAGNCPRCNSHVWQSAALLHQKSVRTNESGRRTISALGELVAPPERRSLVIGPILAGLWLASGTWLALMLLLHGLRNPGTWLDLGILLMVSAGFLIGFSVQLALSIRFNSREWPKLNRIWRSARVCGRCGEIFLPDD